MKKLLITSLTTIILFSLTVGAWADYHPTPILIGPVSGVESNQPLLVWYAPYADSCYVDIANKPDLNEYGVFPKENKVFPQKSWYPSALQIWDFKAEGKTLNPGRYYWYVFCFYVPLYPQRLFSLVAYFDVAAPKTTTPIVTPTPTPTTTPIVKKTVATKHHMKICKKNKKYHAKHCKSVQKNRKKTVKNARFHKKKCSKVILIK